MFTHVLAQPSVPVPVRMEGPAQLLTLAPVMLGGQECSAKQVHYELLLCVCIQNMHFEQCILF